MTSSSSNSRTCLCLKKRAIKRQRQHTLRKELKKAKIVDPGCRSSCSKGAEYAFEHDTAQKGKGKRNRSRSLAKHKSEGRQYARKTERSPPVKEDRPPCFNSQTYKKKNRSPVHKGTESDKEQVTVAVVSVANHRPSPRIATGKLLQLKNFEELPLESEGKY